MTDPVTADGRAWARPPALLLGVAAVVVAAGIAMAITGALKTGLSVDDPRHATRLDVYYETGLYTTRTEQRDAGAAVPDQAYVYGPATALLQHGVNLLVHNDYPQHATRSPEAYAARHVVVAGIGVLGLLATAFIAGILLGSWRWGLVAAAALAAVPMWTGHAMFNGKDTPVAAGHTLATLGLVLMATVPPTGRVRRLVPGAAVLTAGTVLMLGTRPGMWPSLAASVTLLGAALAWARSFRWPTATALLGALAASYGVLYWIYPRIFAHPLTMLWKSATSSADYQHLEHPNGRGYIPAHLIQEWPLILLALFVAGTVFAVIRVAAGVRTRSSDAAALLVIGSQAVTLPILGIAYGSAFYQGLRQVLFAVPAQAILATFALATLVTAAHSLRTRAALAAVAGLGLVLPTAAQGGLFPYQYSYANVAADAAGVAVDSDYLGTSYRHFLPKVSPDLKLVCPQFLDDLARNISDCRRRQRGQFSTYWKASDQPTLDLPESREYNAILRGAWTVPTYCRSVDELTRRRNFRTVTISRLVLCHPPATPDNIPPKSRVNPWDPDWTG